MDPSQFINMFNDKNLITIFFKILALFISIMYFLYSVVIAKQTDVMNKTLRANNFQILSTISSIQIAIGAILILLAIFLV
ncbi:MAG: hypothetical protein Q7R95_05670 [bacterium]|nr:hypothetical protein [bacterium]